VLIGEGQRLTRRQRDRRQTVWYCEGERAVTEQCQSCPKTSRGESDIGGAKVNHLLDEPLLQTGAIAA
jgi:hypothetical protein